MSFPKYYLFDLALPGSVRLVFDDHAMHADNFREHLEGFVRIPEPAFDIMGLWKRPNVLLYANGIPNRMRDGVVWIIPWESRATLAEWISKTEWPTTIEAMTSGLRLPGRWFTEEEAMRQWLSWQGISHDVPQKTLEEEAKRRGVHPSRFSEHLKLAPENDD
jgi:hypothetical protein